MHYTVTVEAPAYAEPEADAEKLLDVLPGDDEPDEGSEESPDLITSVGYDEDRKMVRASFRFEADDALDAHTNAVDLWNEGWQEAFGDLAPPSRLAVTVEPVAVPA